ncbi:MAG: GTPase HflX [Deltaproteobacteria bacterium]|nr:GTPase HflX [Deltaproteobacteria bacterium]
MSKKEMTLSLEELGRLVDTSGGTVVGSVSQEIKRVDAATFIGKGKVEEIGRLAEELGADIVVIDDDISPVQNKNLEDRLGLFVLGRTAVILDIFALRAHTKEGKLQVELAQLQYLAPRLVGRGETFSQQVGRIGTRGPGETALECDRRRIRERITKLRRNLESVRAHRRIHRMKRDAVPIPLVSMVGYTNAGKSTLMNAMTDADVFVEDKLFATLDPTIRRLRLPSGREVLLADTVGFIRRLPHELVESFRSTFEEVSYSHMLLHIIDGSDEEAGEHAGTVENVLAEMKLNHKPRIDVINKVDVDEICFKGDRNSVKVSALKGVGIENLLGRLDEALKLEFRRILLRLPFDRGDILSGLYRMGYVWRVEYEGDGILVDCELHQKFYGKYRSYEVVEG